jgi:hypothetical protein
MKKLMMILAVTFAFSSLAYAEEEAVEPQEMLPEYYPKYSPEKGRIVDLDLRKGVLQIGGALFDYSDMVKVYFPSTPNGNLTMLREGQSILYELNSNNKITSIWVLPNSLEVMEK